VALSRTDGVEVGFDETFERKWIRFEHYVWLGMIALVAGGLAGVFGRGPAARSSTRIFPVQVEYERIARYQTPTQFIVTVAAGSGRRRLFIGRQLLDRLSLQNVVPQPAGAEPRDDGAVLLFPEESGGTRIILVAQPSSVGVIDNTIGVADGPRITFRQLVVP